jgi:RNA recognition motif-containing protein
MNIYVGNLAWEVTGDDLKGLFEYFGEVNNAIVITDSRTKRSKGFGFVEMEDETQARIAMEKLNNTVFKERTLVVNEAKSKND